MGLRFVVLTGVARDDLPDGGARIWAATIRAVRDAVPGCGVEVLPTDFKGGERDIATVIDAEPDVFAHNLETVRAAARPHPPRVRLRPLAGGPADREASPRRPGHEVEPDPRDGRDGPPRSSSALADLRDAGCDIVTMGQYLQPTKLHLPVDRWVTPEEFAEHKRRGRGDGHPPRRGRTARPELVPRRRAVPAARPTRSPSCATSGDGIRREEPACKPDPVRRLAAGRRPSLSALARRGAVRRRRAAYPGARTGRPRALPAWPCSGWGLPSRPGRPDRW